MVFSMFLPFAFPENASFKISGTICRSLPPSLLSGELSTDKQTAMVSFQFEKYIQLVIVRTKYWQMAEFDLATHQICRMRMRA